jgi:transcriptional regulator with XRE-family HTH domain
MVYYLANNINSKEIIMSIGENIRRIRVNKGLTQGELAQKSGVRLGQISKIERDEVDSRISSIIKIMSALDCSADSVFMDEEREGMRGVLKEAFELASELPERKQESLIDIMEDVCVANGLNKMMRNHRILIDISKEHGKKDESPSLLAKNK